MSDDYSIEDAHMANCPHHATFIMWDRLCQDCGAIIKSEVIEPGTESITHHVHWPTTKEN